jgi:hypothetical protein
MAQVELGSRLNGNISLITVKISNQRLRNALGLEFPQHFVDVAQAFGRSQVFCALFTATGF